MDNMQKTMTQAELSNHMEISLSYVSRLLNGEKVLNKELIVTFSEIKHKERLELIEADNQNPYVQEKEHKL